jgi:hypothetical protein
MSTSAIEVLSLKWFIDKYGEIEGTIKYKKNCKKYSNTLKNFILRHGKEKGNIKFKKYCKKCGHDIDFFINKYGQIEGTKKYNEWVSKCRVSLGSASKESMNIFFPLIDWLLEKEICTLNEIYVGIKDNQEYFLNAKKELDTFYWYDFTIPKLKVIIEYNGEIFHPNPIWLKENIEKWNTWKSPYSRENANTVYKKNQDKINFAEKRGFNILEIWSSDSVKNNLQKCKTFIKNLKLEKIYEYF